MNSRNIKKINEELSKSEIRNMINSEIESNLKSKELEKRVKEISAKVLEELYKIMWSRKSFWSDAIKK